MEATEKAELLALGRDLAGALQSPWQPRTVSGAFATRGPGELSFTLQHWIDLDALRSPVLLGAAPETPEMLAATLAVFGFDCDDSDGETAALQIAAIQREIHAGFACLLPMTPPQHAGESAGDDGFGDWAPLYAFLVTQAKVSPSEARLMRVGEAYILMAAHRRNQGWRVAGTPYALRDVLTTGDTEEGGDV